MSPTTFPFRLSMSFWLLFSRYDLSLFSLTRFSIMEFEGGGVELSHNDLYFYLQLFDMHMYINKYNV